MPKPFKENFLKRIADKMAEAGTKPATVNRNGKTVLKNTKELENNKKYYEKCLLNSQILGDGVYLSMDTRFTQRNCNSIVFGSPGTGKTRHYIKPNILNMNSSFVVVDPDGELYQDLSAGLEKSGYHIKLFNLSEEGSSMKYNPLYYVHTTVDIEQLVDTIILNINKFNRSVDNQMMGTLICAIIGYMYETYPVKQRTFANMITLLKKADFYHESELDKLMEALTDRIGEYALAFTDNLAYCELPDSLETIGAYAFYSSGLHDIEIPENVTEIDHNAFDSCKNMSSVILNDNLRSIGVAAFRYEPDLTKITIPDSVESIGSCAFQDTGLKYVYVPCNVEEIGENAFENIGTVCYSGLAWTYDGFGAENFHQFSNSNTCDLCGATLEYVPYTIESAEFIEDGVCNIPEIFERNGVRYKVFSIGTGAYKRNTKLKILNIPDSVISIQDEAFAGCTNLQQVALNDCLSELGYNVFCNCTSLEEIIIPDSIETITGCFSGCANLREITLPKEISLSTMDFEGCDNLRTVCYKGTEKEWNSKTVGAPAPVMSVPIDTLFEENVEVVFEN